MPNGILVLNNSTLNRHSNVSLKDCNYKIMLYNNIWNTINYMSQANVKRNTHTHTPILKHNTGTPLSLKAITSLAYVYICNWAHYTQSVDTLTNLHVTSNETLRQPEATIISVLQNTVVQSVFCCTGQWN